MCVSFDEHGTRWMCHKDFELYKEPAKVMPKPKADPKYIAGDYFMGNHVPYDVWEWWHKAGRNSTLPVVLGYILGKKVKTDAGYTIDSYSDRGGWTLDEFKRRYPGCPNPEQLFGVEKAKPVPERGDEWTGGTDHDSKCKNCDRDWYSHYGKYCILADKEEADKPAPKPVPSRYAEWTGGKDKDNICSNCGNDWYKHYDKHCTEEGWKAARDKPTPAPKPTPSARIRATWEEHTAARVQRVLPSGSRRYLLL